MKNKLFLLSLLILTFVFTNAQKNTASLVSSSDTETVIKFNVNSYNLQTVETQNGKEFVIKAEDASKLLTAEAPDLAKFTKSIIIPDNSKMKIEVISSEFKEIDIETNIAPSKGNLSRTVNPNDVPYTYGTVYNQNEFFPGELTNLSTPYIVRDYRGQAVNIYPFQYNPTTKKLRIYTEITVKISATSEIGENVFNRTKNTETIEREFNEIYKHQFINYNQTKYDHVLEEGNMLVICYDDWTAEMQPLVDWKNMTGRPCEMVTVIEAGGTASAIGTYVENYYNDNGLTYLLLVGDAEQLPTNSGSGLGGESDNAYAYVAGDDHYLEFFVGRFSAETAAHVTTQVQRTITYENGSELTTGWLNKPMGFGSIDGNGGDDGELDWEHYRNMAIDLEAFTYTDSYEHFEGSQGGNDASGNPTASAVANDINTNGVGIINYTGHGSENSWATSGFSSSDVNNLTNDNKLPFIWSVACVNGNFVGQDCFGEAWLRATNNGEPTGAIAIMASTINQDWNPPMDAQDEMVDLLVGASTNGTKRTFGGLSINGCHHMNDEYSTSGFAMTDTWVCFGDPSLLVRTADVSDMVISHNPTISVGQSEFVVNCDLDGGFACLSKDGVIIGTATVSGGIANITVGSVTPGDELTIAVTGFNKVTYIATVTVIAPTGPYITIESFDIDGGNSIDYGQTQNIDITLKNVGPEDATSVTGTLTTTNEYVVSITNNDVSFGIIIGDNGTASSTANYTVELADNIPNGQIVSFDLSISSTNKTEWNGTLNVVANAPEFEITGMTITNDDDNNGRLDPAETADLTFTVNNIGNADASDILASLLDDSGSFDILDDNQTVSINADGTLDVVFSVEASGDAAEGTLVNLTMNVDKNIVYTAEFEQELTIGQEPMTVIGEGTETSGYFPFYTFYENNKTQMLYLGSEIGAGDNLIQEIAFDFTNTDGTITALTDLQINFKETSLTVLGSSYTDMTGATTVLSSASYTMPQTNGWYSFDIDNFVFDATQNLIIEIIWGDNNDYSDSGENYKLNCTSTDFTSISYGYADDELPPNYDDNSSVRPNVTMYFGIIEPATAINEKENNINIYPNPSNGIFNINLENTDNTIEIYNINGQLILSQKANDSNTTIDLSSQAKGVYFVKITSEQNVYNNKIIIK